MEEPSTESDRFISICDKYQDIVDECTIEPKGIFLFLMKYSVIS